jgi:hypothetical protein
MITKDTNKQMRQRENKSPNVLPFICGKDA